MEGSGTEDPRRGWGAALLFVALAILLLPGALPVLATILACLFLGLPPRRLPLTAVSVAWLGIYGVQLAGAGVVEVFMAAWVLGAGAAFAAVTGARREWPFLTRAALSVATSFVVAGGGVAVAGRWGHLERTAAEMGRRVVGQTIALGGRGDPAQAEAMESAARMMVELNRRAFPALVALELLILLALGWWLYTRFLAGSSGRALGRLADFRFNDHLVWVLIAAVAVVLLPLGDWASRVGENVLLVMGALYFLRGLGIFLYFGERGATLFLALGMIVTFFVPPVPLLLGLGDTWLDIRRRATPASAA